MTLPSLCFILIGTHTQNLSLSFLIMILTKRTYSPEQRMREQKLCISLRTFMLQEVSQISYDEHPWNEMHNF